MSGMNNFPNFNIDDYPSKVVTLGAELYPDDTKQVTVRNIENEDVQLIVPSIAAVEMNLPDVIKNLMSHDGHLGYIACRITAASGGLAVVEIPGLESDHMISVPSALIAHSIGDWDER